MAQQYAELSEKQKEFIAQQKIFFVGTATADSRINISPKGMQSMRILGNNRIAWLNVTGSGNETAAHVQENPRMTIMFSSFEGDPLILRVYGQARVVHRNDQDWHEMFSLFDPLPGARQIFDLAIDLVQNSCAMAVPFFNYVEERDQLNVWATGKGEVGIKAYWEEKNQRSMDGLPTNIVIKNT